MWLSSVLKSGTLADKQAALVTRIQEAPLHRMRELDSLLAMVAKKGKREALMGVGKAADIDVIRALPSP